MKVRDLQPGMLVLNGGERATFITATIHPLYPGLAMVIWMMSDGHPGFGESFGRISMDALSPLQDVGSVDPDINSPEDCFNRLREVLTPGSV